MILHRLTNSYGWQIALLIFIALISVGCSKSGDNPGNNLTSPINAATGRMLFPVIQAASVEVYALPLNGAGPLVSTTTSSNNDFNNNGWFSLLNSTIQENGLYLLSVSGGTIIDADLDGIQDNQGLPNPAVYHSVFSGAQILKGNLQVSLLNELLYQRLFFALNANYDNATIIKEADRFSPALVHTDLNNSGSVDSTDLAVLDPYANSSAMVPTSARLRAVQTDLLAGNNISEQALQITEFLLALNDGPPNTPANSLNALENFYTDVVEADGLLYAGLHTAGIQTLNAARPTEILDTVRFSEFYNLPDTRIVKRGNKVYQKLLNNIAIWDVSDPNAIASTPIQISLTTSKPDLSIANVWAIQVEQYGNSTLAFFLLTPANQIDTELHVVDITNSSAPVWLYSLTTPANAKKFSVQGDYAYFNGALSNATGQFHIYTVSSTAMTLVISPNSDFKPNGELEPLLAENYFVVTGRNSENRDGIELFDVSQPSAPVSIGSFVFPQNLLSQCPLQGAHVQGNLLLISYAQCGIQVFDIGLSGTVRAIAKLGEMTGYGMGLGLAGSSGTVHVADHRSGLSHYRLAGFINPATDMLRGAYAYDSTEFAGLAIQGQHAHVMKNGNTYQVLDIADPVHVSTLLTLSVDNSEAIAVSGNVAYIGADNGNVTIVDSTASPPTPRSLSVATTKTMAVQIDGNLLYIGNQGASGQSGSLSIFDISDQSNPVPVLSLYALANLTTERQAGLNIWDMLIENQVLYIASGRGLLVYDVANPAVPTRLATYDVSLLTKKSDGCKRLVKQGSSVFLTDFRKTQLLVIDVSQPSSPSLSNTIQITGEITDIALMDGIAYISAREAGTHLYDVSQPLQLKRIGHIPTPTRAMGLSLTAEYLMIRNETQGLQFFNRIAATNLHRL